MELFAELVPGMKRVGVVRNPNNPNQTDMLEETEDAVLEHAGSGRRSSNLR
jgi:ABC-type uncharacterized transport system substrate-binding protein